MKTQRAQTLAGCVYGVHLKDHAEIGQVFQCCPGKAISTGRTLLALVGSNFADGALSLEYEANPKIHDDVKACLAVAKERLPGPPEKFSRARPNGLFRSQVNVHAAGQAIEDFEWKLANP